MLEVDVSAGEEAVPVSGNATPELAGATRPVVLRRTDPVTVATEFAERETWALLRNARTFARTTSRLSAKALQRASSSSRSSGKKVGGNDLIPSELVSYTSKRLQALPIFSPAGYLEMNPSLKGKVRAPARHAAAKGAVQAVQVFRPEEVARALSTSRIDSGQTAELEQLDVDQLVSRVGPISILVSSCGNIFMNEIAEDLARDLRALGVSVEVRDENADQKSVADTTVVVAPHEFFLLGRGLEWISNSFVRNTFVYNTEQMQTPWFARALPWVLGSRGVLDICPQVPQILKPGRVAAIHIEPSLRFKSEWLRDEDFSHPMVRALPWPVRIGKDVPWQERPYDISFFGNQSPRRDDLLARHTSRFADYESFIYYTRRSRPIDSGPLTRIAGHVASQSKIVLNIHRDEFPYFEWHRIVGQGMASRSIVITDRCLPHPIYQPGVHYFQTEARHIPNMVDWVLKDERGRSAATQMLENIDEVAESTVHRSNGAAAALKFIAENK